MRSAEKRAQSLALAVFVVHYLMAHRDLSVADIENQLWMLLLAKLLHEAWTLMGPGGTIRASWGSSTLTKGKLDA